MRVVHFACCAIAGLQRTLHPARPTRKLTVCVTSNS
jgi:hypothetical protein